MNRPFVLGPLFQSTKVLTGVGPKFVKLLEKTAGPRVLDILWMLPTGLVDRRYTPPLVEAISGKIATIPVRVEAHYPSQRPHLPYKIKCLGTDGAGFLDLLFFNPRTDYLESILPVGEERIVSGKLDRYNGYLQMSHPDYILPLAERHKIPSLESIYPLTAGLTQRIVQKIVRQALPLTPDLPEWHTSSLLTQERWPTWKESLLAIHQPTNEEAISPLHPMRRRLAYDELLSHQLALNLIRRHQKRGKGRILSGDETLLNKAFKTLPFTLTEAQKNALNDILSDMKKPERMLRLLQGDVGSGKTAVAFLSMVHAIASGGQAALMAPTEILARQHAQTLEKYASPLGIKCAVLTGRDKGKAREKILTQLANGEAQFIIGTHAIFQESVPFKDLALIIIDEQHRFGVHQRLQLSDKGHLADILVMTATPIPRTLTMTAYGDMDVSRLHQKPAGRQPIDTRLVCQDRLEEVIQALHRKVSSGTQIYWVCPLIEESEVLDLAAAQERYETLQILFGARVGLLHGRMKPSEKDAVMAAFSTGRLDILVSTTVIEVGVDVPAATVMIIEHAERFGLAQLHQLRGRVGRGKEQSTCLLLYTPQLNPIAKQRLETMRTSEDGFLIAEKDLELRGAGEVLGTRQSGLPHFRLVDLDLHQDLMAMAHDDARLALHQDPALSSSRSQALRTLLYLFERDTAIQYLRSG